MFDRFSTIVILLESAITYRGTTITKEKLSKFIEEHCAGVKDYHEITEQIKETEIKHFYPKILKFSQQLYAFVYGCLIEFPRISIEYKTVTTVRNVYRIIKVKTHLHHSHTTGKILGYVHDVCNWGVRIKQNFLV